MRTERIAAWILVTLAGCASVEEPHLPPPPSPELAAVPLTRARCIELALQSVPTAAAWRARLDAAHAALAGASRLPNPTLGLSFEDLGLGGVDVPVQTTLLLGEALADVAARGRREAAAKHSLAAEEQHLLAERADLGAEVSRAYDALYAARRRVDLDRELQGVAQEQRRAVARFVELGESPRLDLERADAELLDAQLQLSSDEAASNAREIELCFALGFERPVALELAEGFTQPSDVEAQPLEALLESAARESPRLKAAVEEYLARLERAHLAASGVRFLPVVRAGPRTVDGDTLAVVELEAELPLFDQGQAERGGASAELLAGAAEVRRVALELSRSIALAQAAIHATDSRLEQQARPLAEERAAIRARTEVQFHAGEADYLDLVTARRDEEHARLVVLDAELDLASARTQLEQMLGQP